MFDLDDHDKWMHNVKSAKHTACPVPRIPVVWRDPYEGMGDAGATQPHDGSAITACLAREILMDFQAVQKHKREGAVPWQPGMECNAKDERQQQAMLEF